MFIEFDKEYLRELFELGRTSDKKHRFQPEVVRAYKRCVDKLVAASSIESLYQHHSLNYEVLVGDKAGISSVRINSKYRLEFRVRHVAEQEIITVCLILDISNHYR
jgi:proteic killer suppression protein